MSTIAELFARTGLQLPEEHARSLRNRDDLIHDACTLFSIERILQRASEVRGSGWPGSLVPFAETDSGDHYAYVVAGGEPVVTFVDHETGPPNVVRGRGPGYAEWRARCIRESEPRGFDEHVVAVIERRSELGWFPDGDFAWGGFFGDRRSAVLAELLSRRIGRVRIGDLVLRTLDVSRRLPNDLSQRLRRRIDAVDRRAKWFVVGADALTSHDWSQTLTQVYVHGPADYAAYAKTGVAGERTVLSMEVAERLRTLGLVQVSQQEMQRIIDARPIVLSDPQQRSAGAYTVVPVARQLGDWLGTSALLGGCTPPENVRVVFGVATSSSGVA